MYLCMYMFSTIHDIILNNTTLWKSENHNNKYILGMYRFSKNYKKHIYSLPSPNVKEKYIYVYVANYIHYFIKKVHYIKKLVLFLHI
jgi:hypothetical protein